MEGWCSSSNAHHNAGERIIKENAAHVHSEECFSLFASVAVGCGPAGQTNFANRVGYAG